MVVASCSAVDGLGCSLQRVLQNQSVYATTQHATEHGVHGASFGDVPPARVGEQRTFFHGQGDGSLEGCCLQCLLSTTPAHRQHLVLVDVGEDGATLHCHLFQCLAEILGLLRLSVTQSTADSTNTLTRPCQVQRLHTCETRDHAG